MFGDSTPHALSVANSNSRELIFGKPQGLGVEKNTKSARPAKEGCPEAQRGVSSRFRTTRYQSASRCVLKPFLRYIDNGPGKSQAADWGFLTGYASANSNPLWENFWHAAFSRWEATPWLR